MSGTVCRIIDDYADKKLLLPTRRVPSWAVTLAVVAASLLVFAGLFAAAQGVLDEYRAAVAGRAVAEDRAAVAEAKLAEVMVGGNQGVLLANVSKELVGWQVRIVPAVNNFKRGN